MADIKKIKLPNNSEYNLVDDSATHIQTITFAQWNALTPEQQASGDYVITDAPVNQLSASLIPYDNTTSGLTADDVQEAIDEITQGGIVGSLNDLTDVNISSVTNKQELVYDSTDSEFKNKTTRIELTQAQYNALTTPETDVDYYIKDAPSMSGTSADLSYDGTTKSVYTKIGEMDTTISGKAATSSLATVATSGSYNDLINKPTRTDVKSQVTFNEDITGTNTRFYLKSGCLYIFYQGESKSHSANDVLFTLPTSLKPTGTVYCPCVVNSEAFGDIEISNTGSTKINQLSATASGRVYFHCVIPLE